MSKRVYVVCLAFSGEVGEEIIGIYSTEAKARARADKWERERGQELRNENLMYKGCFVEDWLLDWEPED